MDRTLQVTTVSDVEWECEDLLWLGGAFQRLRESSKSAWQQKWESKLLQEQQREEEAF